MSRKRQRRLERLARTFEELRKVAQRRLEAGVLEREKQRQEHAAIVAALEHTGLFRDLALASAARRLNEITRAIAKSDDAIAILRTRVAELHLRARKAHAMAAALAQQADRLAARRDLAELASRKFAASETLLDDIS